MVRAATAVLVLLSVVLGAYLVRNALGDPMAPRRTALENRLQDIVPEKTDYLASARSDFSAERGRITGKSAIWRELVPAPPRPPARKMPPNLRRKLSGVVPTRTSIGSGSDTKALIKSTENPRGAFIGVGEQINGVTLLRIEKTVVVFGVTQQGVDYTHEIPRR